MEAQGASGQTIAKEHVEVLAFSNWIWPVSFAAAILGMAGVFAAARFIGGWLGVPLIVVGAFVGLVGLGSIGFMFWGRYWGFPWHFTP